MLDKYLIFALIFFIWVQGSSQDKTKYKMVKKVSFAADENLKKYKATPSQSSSQLQDFMSQRKLNNFKITRNTEFQVKTKDSAIYLDTIMRSYILDIRPPQEPLNALSQIPLALDLISKRSFRLFICQIACRLKNFSHKKHFFAIVASLVFFWKKYGQWWLRTILPDHFPVQ